MIGAINLTCTVDTNFSDHDERLVSRVAERITPTLERVRLSDDRGDHRFTSPSLTADREIRYATSTAAEWRTVTTGPPVVEDVAPDGAPRRRVLVVDDEPLVLDLVEAVLSDSDCAVQCVRSGEEAIRRLNAEEFDLLISDLRMPGIGGLDLVEWMRSVGNNSEVLFMTGEINGGDLKDLVAQSGVTFLSKPFRIGELLDAVESLFKLSTREGLRSHR